MVPLVPTLTMELHAFAILHQVIIGWGFAGGSDSKESACSVGDLGSTPGLGRSPGGIESRSPSLQVNSLPSEPPGKP